MKVLFATDGSENAQLAARTFASIQFEEPYELIIATVSYDPTLPHNRYLAWQEQWRRYEIERIEKAHDEIECVLKPYSNNVIRKHVTGVPTRDLLQIADAESVDLIVIGAVGHGAVRRIFLGSVSDHVATHANCSVLVVRPHELQSDEPASRVMLAYDGSDPSKDLIREFKTLHFADNVEVDVTTIHEQAMQLYDAHLAYAYEEISEETMESQRDENLRVVTELRERFPDVHSVVERGYSPGETMCTLAESNATQLIFVADSGHTFWDDILLGSCTKYVLRHSPCSVWISRKKRVAAAEKERHDASPQAFSATVTLI